MQNIASMNCPSCGGGLEIKPGQNTSTCPYCGNTHILQEPPQIAQTHSANACPQCGSDDQVRRLQDVSANAKFSGLLQPHIPPPQHPLPPEGPPPPGERPGCTISPMLGTLLVIALIALSRQHTSGLAFPTGLVTILIVAFIFMRRRPGRFKRRRLRNLAQNRHEWRRTPTAWQRFDRAYYCERDDLLFIPGETITQPRQNLAEFLRQAG